MTTLKGNRMDSGIPIGDTCGMYSAVRDRLGIAPDPRPVGENGIKSYQQDIKEIAHVMIVNGYTRICALGPKHTNSHAVAWDITSALDTANCSYYKLPLPARVNMRILLTHTISDVLGRMEGLGVSADGMAGLVPVANTLGGLVMSGGDTLSNIEHIERRRLAVLGLVGARIGHHLASAGQLGVDDIHGRPVYSHPQALAQCQGLIEKHGLRPCGTTSTAAAAQRLSDSPDSDALAIVPQAAVLGYGLEEVVSDVGDRPAEENITLMAVVGVPDPSGERRRYVKRLVLERPVEIRGW